MIFYIIASIAYRQKLSVYIRSSQYQLPSFGFDANGTYLIDVQDIPATMQSGLQVALLNKKQYKSYFFKFFPPSLCDISDYPKYDINPSYHTLQGTLSEKTVLFPYILQCNSVYQRFDLSIITEYHNPTTNLDTRMVNARYSEMVICILYLAFTGAWLCYLIKYRKYSNGLQYCLTVIITSFLLSHIIRLFEIRKQDTSDNSQSLTNARIIFIFIGATFCGLYFLLGSEGYCTLVDDLEKPRVLTHFIVSLLFNGCLFLTFYYNFSSGYFKMIVLDMFAFLFFGYELYTAMKRANAQLAALLLAASNSGAEDSAGTLFRTRQYELFQKMLVALVATIIAFLIISNAAFLVPLWLSDFTQSLAELALVAAAAFVFRPRSAKSQAREAAGITRRLIEDDENEAAEVDSAADGDEIPLISLDSPMPNQPLLRQESTKGEKKGSGNNNYSKI